jgi:hypothetical protein
LTTALEASLKGEIDAYLRRVYSRIGLGLVGSVVGCGLLGWGFIPIKIDNVGFSDALKVCASSSSCEAIAKGLTVIAVGMLLGFSERALSTFEPRFIGEMVTTKKSNRVLEIILCLYYQFLLSVAVKTR